MANYTFTIKTEEKEYTAVLREPLFLDYRMCMMSLNNRDGLDTLACGSSLVQHCWIEGDEELKKGDETKNPVIAKAYVTLCNKVYNEIASVYHSDVKKK
jgi:hypothetical protein